MYGFRVQRFAAEKVGYGSRLGITHLEGAFFYEDHVFERQARQDAACLGGEGHLFAVMRAAGIFGVGPDMIGLALFEARGQQVEVTHGSADHLELVGFYGRVFIFAPAESALDRGVRFVLHRLSEEIGCLIARIRGFGDDEVDGAECDLLAVGDLPVRSFDVGADVVLHVLFQVGKFRREIAAALGEQYFVVDRRFCRL